MLELLVVGAVGLVVLVVVPLLLLEAVFGLAIGLIALPFKLLAGAFKLIALPFKLLAGAFKLGGALLGGIMGLAGALFGGIFAVVCLALCLPLLLLAVPLIPLLIVAAGLCLLFAGGFAIVS